MQSSTAQKLLREVNAILAWVGLLKADKYDLLADELTNTLLHKWNAETKTAINDMIAELRKASGKPKAADIDARIAELAQRLGPSFANNVAAPLYEVHVQSFTAGLADVKPGYTAKFNLVDEKALDALHKHNLYWVREQWDKNLRDTTEEIGRKVIKDGLTYRQAGELFEQELGEQYKMHGTNYWRGFATNVVTRSREIGHVNGYERAGVTELEIRAVLDYRTSKICRHMHGRRVKVAKAIEMRDAMLAAETPEEAVKAAPWYKEDFVRGKKTTDLPAGLSLPTYHFRCRSRTVVASDYDEPVESAIGDKMSKDDKKFWNAYTGPELATLARTVKEKKQYTWDKDALAKFAEALGEEPATLRERAAAVFAGEPKLYGYVEDGGHAWMLYNSTARRAVFVNGDMRISGISGPVDSVSGLAKKMISFKFVK